MLPPTNHIAKVGGGVLARQALISIACRAVVLHHNSITAYSGLYHAQTGERWDFHDPTLELMCWFNTSSIQFTSKVKKFVDQNMSRFNGVSLNDLVFRPTPRASGSQLLENLLHSFMSSYYSVSLCIDHQTVVVLTIWPNLQSPIPLQSVPYRKTDAILPMLLYASSNVAASYPTAVHISVTSHESSLWSVQKFRKSFKAD